MAPSFCIDLSEAHQRQLLAIARQSIQRGLNNQRLPRPAPGELAEPLRARLGTFVTLTRERALRGCIGSLQSSEPLHSSVADAAYSAAFRDPRFPRLQAGELPGVTIEISVLSGLAPIAAADRARLLGALRPGRDGLVLEDGHYRSTFLPKVWEQLPDPDLFLDHLLAKAGLPETHWSATLRFSRYETLSFSD